MRVAICHTKDTVHGLAICKYFAEGILNSSDEVVHLAISKKYDYQVTRWYPGIKLIYVDSVEDYVAQFNKCDVAFQVCPTNAYKGKTKTDHADTKLDIQKALAITGKRLLIIDTSFTDTRKLQFGEDIYKFTYDTYYSLGFDEVKNRADYYNENSPSDRWDDLGIELKPYRSGSKYLIIGQTLRGASSYDIDINVWYQKLVLKIIQQDKHPNIIFRAHPRLVNKLHRVKTFHNIINKIAHKFSLKIQTTLGTTLEKDLEDVGLAFTYSSNAAVKILIEGIPLLCASDYCMAHPVSNTNYKCISDPKTYDRTQWAYNLAYAQWSGKEMQQGLPWQHLRKHI